MSVQERHSKAHSLPSMLPSIMGDTHQTTKASIDYETFSQEAGPLNFTARVQTTSVARSW